MPTYEFRCANGHTFDQFHKISDAPSTATCPTCGAEAVRAISGGAGLVFKGSGFYLTDYGKNAHRTSGTAPAKGGEGSGESKSGDGAKSGDGGKGGDGAASKDAGGGASKTGNASGGSSGGSAGGSTGGTSGGSTGASSGGASSGGSSSSGGSAA